MKMDGNLPRSVFKVKCMADAGNNSWVWPKSDDELWYNYREISGPVAAPQSTDELVYGRNGVVTGKKEHSSSSVNFKNYILD